MNDDEYDDLMKNNPFEDDVLYAKCQAYLDRGRGLVTDEGDRIERLVQGNMPFMMALAKLASSGMEIVRGGDLMALFALIMAVIEDEKTDETARSLLDYEGGEIDLE